MRTQAPSQSLEVCVKGVLLARTAQISPGWSRHCQSTLATIAQHHGEGFAAKHAAIRTAHAFARPHRRASPFCGAPNGAMTAALHLGGAPKTRTSGNVDAAELNLRRVLS